MMNESLGSFSRYCLVSLSCHMELLPRLEHFVLEAPLNLTVELKKDQNDWSYFAMTVDVPETVRLLPRT